MLLTQIYAVNVLFLCRLLLFSETCFEYKLTVAKEEQEKEVIEMGILNKNLVILDADVSSAEECIRKAGDLFFEYGYVAEGYVDEVLEREKIYPTGLPGKGISIAIPHTTNKLVNKPAIGVIIPRKPVQFAMMGTKDSMLDCEIIMPLVIKDSNSQIATLRKLMHIIQDGELLKKIRDSKNEDEVLDCLGMLED